MFVMNKHLSLYYETSIYMSGSNITHNDFNTSGFQHLLRVFSFFFFLRSSIKLNYFLRELGLDREKKAP